MKYIDVEKLKAEIERRLVKYDSYYTSAGSELKELLSFINSIQQEQPEVDLEKEDELEREINNAGMAMTEHNPSWKEVEQFARHFYELGLNARKEKSK